MEQLNLKNGNSHAQDFSGENPFKTSFPPDAPVKTASSVLKTIMNSSNGHHISSSSNIEEIEDDNWFLNLIKLHKIEVHKNGWILIQKDNITVKHSDETTEVTLFDKITKQLKKITCAKLVWLTFNGSIPDGHKIEHIYGVSNKLSNLKLVPDKTKRGVMNKEETEVKEVSKDTTVEKIEVREVSEYIKDIEKLHPPIDITLEELVKIADTRRLTIEEKDKLFIELVKKGRLVVTKDCVVMNARTKTKFYNKIAIYYLNGHVFDINTNRLTWLIYKGPIKPGYSVFRPKNAEGQSIDNLFCNTAYTCVRKILTEKDIPQNKHKTQKEVDEFFLNCVKNKILTVFENCEVINNVTGTKYYNNSQILLEKMTITCHRLAWLVFKGPIEKDVLIFKPRGSKNFTVHDLQCKHVKRKKQTLSQEEQPTIDIQEDQTVSDIQEANVIDDVQKEQILFTDVDIQENQKVSNTQKRLIGYSNSRFTEKDVLYIRHEFKQLEKTLLELTKKYNSRTDVIKDIILGKSFPDIENSLSLEEYSEIMAFHFKLQEEKDKEEKARKIAEETAKINKTERIVAEETAKINKTERIVAEKNWIEMLIEKLLKREEVIEQISTKIEKVITDTIVETIDFTLNNFRKDIQRSVQNALTKISVEDISNYISHKKQ
jgi:hypothetical protein